MESITITKFIIGVLFIFGVGVVAVMMQDNNPRQMATDSYMLTTRPSPRRRARPVRRRSASTPT